MNASTIQILEKELRMIELNKERLMEQKKELQMYEGRISPQHQSLLHFRQSGSDFQSDSGPEHTGQLAEGRSIGEGLA